MSKVKAVLKEGPKVIGNLIAFKYRSVEHNSALMEFENASARLIDIKVSGSRGRERARARVEALSSACSETSAKAHAAREGFEKAMEGFKKEWKGREPAFEGPCE